MKTVAIIQARMSSRRLPGKVLEPVIEDKSMLACVIERVQLAERVNHVVVATSDSKDDDPIASLCEAMGVACFRGGLDDVLGRYAAAAECYAADVIVRITADCPVIDFDIIDRCVEAFHDSDYDYVSNTITPSFPDGLDVEVFSRSALDRAYREASFASEREHVTLYINNHPEIFSRFNVVSDGDYSALRWTVDEKEDLELIRAIYNQLYSDNPRFNMHDILKLLEQRPELLRMNSHFQRNEGLRQSLLADKQVTRSRPKGTGEYSMNNYTKSQQHYAKAKEFIPLGTQTYSKSVFQYPYGVSPLYADRADGAYLWDVDGNQFIDLVGALWTVGLGYKDKDVMSAVMTQLESGSIFSLSHTIECDVAELITRLVPCAEMVRFAKNGTDVTSAAIRLSRAATNRDHVAICGYHGWQDWYISITNKKRGIPQQVTELSHHFRYNDIESLKALFAAYPNQIAAVILEPMNMYFPKDNFLQHVRELCDTHGAVLVFDEIVTGFRMSVGGAQEVFGVTPDLATFGKSIANGMPLSVLAGKRHLMSLLDDVYFSGTFGGEALSLAAAKAVLEKIQHPEILTKIHKQGAYLADALARIIEQHGLEHCLSFSGHAHWKHLLIKDYDNYTAIAIKTFILKESFARGVLTLGPSYISYALSDQDLESILSSYDEVLYALSNMITSRKLHEATNDCLLKPVFSVREA